MILHLKIVGVLFVLLALIHTIFPRYFQWEKELSMLSLMNRQMMQVHTFFIALTILLMGLLCLTTPMELLNTLLGKRICFCFGIFWLARLFIQFFGYSSTLWKGKTFETCIHVLFVLIWTYFTWVFMRISFF